MPLRQRLVGVVGRDRDGTLQDDRAVVRLLVDEVHRGTGDPHAVLERLALRVQSLEGGQERRVDVHDASRKRVEQDARDEAVEAGEHDQLDPGVAQRRRPAAASKASRVGNPRWSRTRVGDAGARGRAPDRRPSGRFEMTSADAAVERAVGDAVEDRLQVGARFRRSARPTVTTLSP